MPMQNILFLFFDMLTLVPNLQHILAVTFFQFRIIVHGS